MLHKNKVRASWCPKSVPTAVTDNTSNEKKAFDILQWTHFGCFGHRLNLIVKKALAVNEVSTLVTKARKLVTFVHSSTSATEILREKQEGSAGQKLLQDVPTRWNSTDLMLERIGQQTSQIAHQHWANAGPM